MSCNFAIQKKTKKQFGSCKATNFGEKLKTDWQLTIPAS